MPVRPVREILQKIMRQANNDCRFAIFTSTNSPATFACWKARFKTEACSCSQFPSEASVEMVESVDDIKSSCSVRGTDFEVLDARIAKQNLLTSKEGQSGGPQSQKEDRFLRGRQIASLIYEFFRVTGANDSVENYANLFTVGLRNDDFQRCKVGRMFIITDKDSTCTN